MDEWIVKRSIQLHGPWVHETEFIVCSLVLMSFVVPLLLISVACSIILCAWIYCVSLPLIHPACHTANLDIQCVSRSANTKRLGKAADLTIVQMMLIATVHRALHQSKLMESWLEGKIVVGEGAQAAGMTTALGGV